MDNIQIGEDLLPSSGKSKYYYLKIVMVIIIFAILGFNIFTNLGYLTDEAAKLVKPVTTFFAGLTAKTTKKVIKTSTKGTKQMADAVDETVDAVDAEVIIPNTELPVKRLSKSIQDINKPIDTNTVNYPTPDESNSYVQQGTTGKKGYCYVGNWNGYRSCVKVNDANRCLSGEMFDSEAICRNPELRE